MRINQLRAIWYAARERQRKAQREYLERMGLVEAFEKSAYKSMTWYIKRIQRDEHAGY